MPRVEGDAANDGFHRLPEETFASTDRFRNDESQTVVLTCIETCRRRLYTRCALTISPRAMESPSVVLFVIPRHPSGRRRGDRGGAFFLAMVLRMVYDTLASFTCPRTIVQDYRLGFTHKALVVAARRTCAPTCSWASSTSWTPSPGPRLDVVSPTYSGSLGDASFGDARDEFSEDTARPGANRTGTTITTTTTSSSSTRASRARTSSASSPSPRRWRSRVSPRCSSAR